MSDKIEKIAYFSLILLIVVLVLIWFIREKQPVDNSNMLKITFLDIGQGDATFIEFPSGEQMLIDCAIDAVVVEALGRTMDFYDRTIDYLVVTHPDLDHYGGCADVLYRFNIKHIIYNGFQKPNSGVWNGFMDAVEKEIDQGAEYIIADNVFDLKVDDVYISYLFPDRPVDVEDTNNNTSIVMRISYGEQDVLLTADAEKELEQYLVDVYDNELDVEILKVGHHGSLTSSILEFLGVTSPKDAIISSGEENNFGHPSARIIKRIERKGVNIWRTDQQGDIIAEIYPQLYTINSSK